MALTKSLSFCLGRKRILISNNGCDLAEFTLDFESLPPMKRRCVDDTGKEDGFVSEDSRNRNPSLLEALPQEILIKIICGVHHEDLNQLIHVSKAVRSATIIAKHSHFAYSTPSKKKVFRNSIDSLNNSIELEELEAPNAPKQLRRMNRPRISEKKLEDILVALFRDDEEEEHSWPRRNLFMQKDR